MDGRSARSLRGLALLILLLLPAAASSQAPTTTVVRDCGDCPEMVLLRGGTYTMGVPPGEEERETVPVDLRGRSQPLTRVTIQPGLGMAARPVTRGEFADFVAATGYAPGNGCWTFVNTGSSYEYLEEPDLDWRNPGFPQTDSHPVVCVNWGDANAYAGWLSARTGKTYRLPSEAEWEYAARAGTTGARFWGDAQSLACQFANVLDLTLAAALNLDRRPQFAFRCNDGFVHTAPVGSFRPNQFGLYDMLGNVWQWTADCLNPDLTTQSGDGSARLTGDCTTRMMRGGSWGHLPWHVRAGNRARGNAADRFTFAGFRLVRER